MKNLSAPKDLPTQERLNELFDYEQASGKLLWKRFMGGRAKAATEAGNARADGYIRVKVDGTLFLAHRLIWVIETGSQPQNTIDHINGNRGDNRFSNLRDVTHAENLQNLKKARSDSSTGLQGVTRDQRDGAYMAYIRTNGKSRSLGRFKRPEDAHQAYLVAKRIEHSTCTI